MVMTNGRHTLTELPPPLGTRLLVVSRGLEHGYLRSRSLEDIGYRVATCGEPREAGIYAEQLNPEAILLDLGGDTAFLPNLIQSLRECTTGPLVAVGVSGQLSEMAQCLEAGADEVCPPRTSTREIDLRLRALFRIASRPADKSLRQEVETDESPLHVGDLEIDRARRVVRKRGQTIQLSPTEFRLLVTLAENAGRVVPSKALIARVWGEQYASESHYLRLYVRYLRQKLEDDPSQPAYIVNRWGSGYALEEPPRAA